jgi:hypothetical protein
MTSTSMRMVHLKCQGEIDVQHRKCLRCHKTWNWFTFTFNLREIRPMRDKRGRVMFSNLPESPVKQESKTKSPLADLPFLFWVSYLPKWPRWARLLTVALVLAGLARLIQSLI